MWQVGHQIRWVQAFSKKFKYKELKNSWVSISEILLTLGEQNPLGSLSYHGKPGFGSFSLLILDPDPFQFFTEFINLFSYNWQESFNSKKIYLVKVKINKPVKI